MFKYSEHDAEQNRVVLITYIITSVGLVPSLAVQNQQFQLQLVKTKLEISQIFGSSSGTRTEILTFQNYPDTRFLVHLCVEQKPKSKYQKLLLTGEEPADNYQSWSGLPNSMGGTKIKTKTVLIDFLSQNQKLLIKLKNHIILVITL